MTLRTVCVAHRSDEEVHRWEASEIETSHIDLYQLEQSCPHAVTVLIRWLRAARHVHHISVAIGGEIAKEDLRATHGALPRTVHLPL